MSSRDSVGGGPYIVEEAWPLSGTDARVASRVEALQASYLDQGVTFDIGGEERAFPLDVLPRVIEMDQWAKVDTGVQQRRLGLAQPMRRNKLVGDDGRARAGPQFGDAGAQRGQHAAADDDVIGAITEREVAMAEQLVDALQAIGFFDRAGQNRTNLAVFEHGDL